MQNARGHPWIELVDRAELRTGPGPSYAQRRTRPDLAPYPKGIESTSPGLRPRATLDTPQKSPNPTGVASPTPPTPNLPHSRRPAPNRIPLTAHPNWQSPTPSPAPTGRHDLAQGNAPWVSATPGSNPLEGRNIKLVCLPRRPNREPAPSPAMPNGEPGPISPPIPTGLNRPARGCARALPQVRPRNSQPQRGCITGATNNEPAPIHVALLATGVP